MTDEQAAAFAQLRRLAAAMRLRVGPDAEGFPVIRGKLGDIEWYHAAGTHLAAYTAGRLDRLGRLLSLPGITRHQVGDTEVRILFPVGMLAEVARVIQARRKRVGSPAIMENLRRARQKLHGVSARAGSGGSESTRTDDLVSEASSAMPRGIQAAKNCPQCGRPMDATTSGWRCPSCGHWEPVRLASAPHPDIR
jgi:hypothetical protein